MKLEHSGMPSPKRDGFGTHECELEIRALRWCCGAKVPRNVGAVLRNEDAVLVLVGGPGVGFGHPVAGADEGGFCVDVLCQTPKPSDEWVKIESMGVKWVG